MDRALKADQIFATIIAVDSSAIITIDNKNFLLMYIDLAFDCIVDRKIDAIISKRKENIYLDNPGIKILKQSARLGSNYIDPDQILEYPSGAPIEDPDLLKDLIEKIRYSAEVGQHVIPDKINYDIPLEDDKTYFSQYTEELPLYLSDSNHTSKSFKRRINYNMKYNIKYRDSIDGVDEEKFYEITNRYNPGKPSKEELQDIIDEYKLNRKTAAQLLAYWDYLNEIDNLHFYKTHPFDDSAKKIVKNKINDSQFISNQADICKAFDTRYKSKKRY